MHGYVNILWQSELKPIQSEYALLAQLDRVFGYEPKGQGFESLAARHKKTVEIIRVSAVFAFSLVFRLIKKAHKKAHKIVKNSFSWC